MKAAAPGIFGPAPRTRCAAWRWTRRRAAAAGRPSEHEGTTYYFCADECKKRFDAEPRSSPRPGDTYGGPDHAVVTDRPWRPAVIDRSHRLLGQEQVPRPPARRGAAAVAGAWSLQRVPLDAIPDLSDTQVIIYSTLGPQPRRRRGAGHLSHRLRHARRAEGPRRPRLLRFRLLLRLRHLRGRHRHLLGAHADAGVPVGRPRPAAAGRQDGARARRHGAGLGLPVRARGQVGPAQPRRPALLPGLDLRYYLKSVPGVAEVASVGGFGRQYQVNVDPNRLRNYGLSIQRVVEAVRGGNIEAGGRLIEFGGTEYMVRGRGYAQSIADFESIVVSASESGTPIRIRDIGQVVLGPGPPARRVGPRRHRRGGVGHHRDAPGRERPRRHRPRQEAHQGDRAGPAGRG